RTASRAPILVADVYAHGDDMMTISVRELKQLMSHVLRRVPGPRGIVLPVRSRSRSEEHTSELQSRVDLVCRLLLEKKKKKEDKKHNRSKNTTRAKELNTHKQKNTNAHIITRHIIRYARRHRDHNVASARTTE